MAETITKATELIASVLAEVGDGSTVSDAEALSVLLTEEATALKRGLAAYRGMTTVLKEVARLRVAIRSLIITPTGHPDWAGGAGAYRLALASAEAEVWATATSDEKRRSDGTIRQHVSRGGFLEAGIVDYCLRKLPASFDRSVLKWTEEKNGSPALLAGDVPKVLKDLVADEYKAAKMAVPPKFGGAARDGSGAGPASSDPKNPRATFEAAMGAQDSLAPVIAASNILRAASALAEKVRKASEISDREKVEALSLRLAIVGRVTAKVAAGKATEKDLADLEGAAWSKEDAQ